jgi:fructosamine-3-kinase
MPRTEGGRADLARRISQLAGADVRDLREVGTQHGVRHVRVTLAGGREAFAKVAGVGQRPVFEAEARGLRWLADAADAADAGDAGDAAEADAADAGDAAGAADAGGAPVPEVLGWDERALVLASVPPGRATPDAAERFGRELARTHGAGAASFGAPWPGYIASLPLDNRPWPASRGWPEWYAERRIRPFLRRAADDGTLGPGDVRTVETVIARIGEIAGPPGPPARIHGDCWSGNLIWSEGRGWLIDPAAHGGHRETDLAMLALFGAPHLDRILDGYTAIVPLADGWRSRVPLHQLHPLLVHVCLFGAGYRDAALQAARSALSG